jgi:ABC-2 type transport system permease protein
MSAGIIFKMELYKFVSDKKYLIVAGVLAILNTIFTIQMIDSLPSYSYYGSNDGSAIGGLAVLVYIITIILLIIYPFHLLGQDYRNNVLALMMASGVNRTKLYFAKTGAVVLCSLALGFLITIVPAFLVAIKFGSLSVIGEVLNVFSEAFGYFGMSQFLFIISALVVYTLQIVVINAAVIFAKGAMKATLFYLGFSFCQGLITTLLGRTSSGYAYDVNGDLLYGIALNLIIMAGFMFLSLRQMRVQNL